ncbi:DNA-binding protein [Streptomyces sp. NRRL WC-3753]|nr:DNA-binding protein [Streptomyces sp. NRRL WC-3753]
MSKLLVDDARTVAMVAEARRRGMDVVICALALIEAVHARTDRRRLAWVLSGLRVAPVGEEEAKAASALLLRTGLHGHKYAIDAVRAALAQSAALPATLLTSDPEDLRLLCGPAVEVVKV